MDIFRKEAGRVQSRTVIQALRKRQIDGYYADTMEEAKAFILSFVKEGCSVAWGDSLTLEALEVKDVFRRGNYTVHDRDAAADDVSERIRVLRNGLTADYYLTGCNAVTLKGELVNIDGRGNRCAAICFGPEKVLLVAGINKITADTDAAVKRIRTAACPQNAIRHNWETPCALTGKCAECFHPSCMCCDILVTRYNKVPGRISVLLVGEDLGF